MKPKTLAEIFKDDVNSPMIKPIQLDQEQETQTMTAKKTTDRIEAHGVKGMKSTPWRKTFKNENALMTWVDKHDAEIYAIRDAD